MQATDFSALLRVMEKDLLMLEKHMEGINIAPAGYAWPKHACKQSKQAAAFIRRLCLLHPHPTHPSHTCLLNLSRSPSPCSVHTVQFHNLRNILVATLPRVYLPDGFTPDEAHPNTNCSIGQVWGWGCVCLCVV